MADDAAILRGPNLKLTPFTEADIDARYLGWLNDREVNRFLEVRHVTQTRETAAAFVRSFAGDVEKNMWAIRDLASDLAVGTATLHTINRQHGSAEIGILIGEKAFWGGTTAQETLSLVIGFAFGPLALRRITAGTYARHWGMNLLYKKLGFSREGTLRQAYQLEPGVFVDGFRWGLLKEEWNDGPRL